MKIGFAVKILGPDGRGLKTHDARRPQNDPSLGESLRLCTEALAWLDRCNIRFWRLSSDLAPFATHPDRPQFHDPVARYQSELEAFGGEIRTRGMRVTLHPSQYILLSSANRGVTDRSIADLEIQAGMLDAMGIGPDGVIVLHCGGKYGEPEAAAERVIENIAALDPAIRTRLVLENDDRVWSARETHALCTQAGVPMVFDIHHHRCLNPTEDDATDMLRGALATWPSDVTPKIHLSSGRDHPRDRAHAEGIHREDWNECAHALIEVGADCDIVIEAKAKEHAVLDLTRRIRETRTLIRPDLLTGLPMWPEDAPPLPVVSHGAR